MHLSFLATFRENQGSSKHLTVKPFTVKMGL